MTNETLQTELNALNPALVFEAGGEWVNTLVPAAEWLTLAKQIRHNNHLLFDYLFCLTCVDWKTHLTMVYHLSSTVYHHTLVVKAQLNRGGPEIESVYPVWRAADFHEREVSELFGVRFLNHPDLRKLILPDDWIGYPLRKDYEDPINMIKL
jgi:NADH:ubiquinone oxidoreductase subunit C